MGRKPRRRVRRNPKLAIGYLRVSTDAERQDLGAAAQRADIERFAERHGLNIVSWQSDEITGSAALADRPGLSGALVDVQAHNASRVLFQKWDRFGRADQLDTALAEAAFRDASAKLVSCDGIGNDETPEAILMKEQQQSFARYEKARIRARIRAALAVKQSRGEVTGAPKFGYRLAADGIHVEPHPEEQRAVARILALKSQGLSIRAIAEELECEGFAGRTGRPISRDTVHIVLTRA